MPQVQRQRELKRRRKRRATLKRLRLQLAGAKNAQQRTRVVAKIKAISPNAPLPES